MWGECVGWAGGWGTQKKKNCGEGDQNFDSFSR